MNNLSIPEGECILATKMLNTQGYGRMWVRNALGQKRMFYRHRYAWALIHGPIPYGMTLDHLCNQPACFNADHLEPVTLSENVRRRQVRMNQTHCLRGHELDVANLVGGSQWRTCKTCHRERQVQQTQDVYRELCIGCGRAIGLQSRAKVPILMRHLTSAGDVCARREVAS